MSSLLRLVQQLKRFLKIRFELALKYFSFFLTHLDLKQYICSYTPIVSLKTIPGARFTKVPIINGPGKLSPSRLKIDVSIVLHLT